MDYRTRLAFLRWGEKGHSTTNAVAIPAVPNPLGAFYQNNFAYIVSHAMDADYAKDNDPNEHPRHFIDIDLYGAPPFKELPEDYAEAVKKFKAHVIIKRGIVPWQIETTYNDLVIAFTQKSGKDIMRHSAWLGHYVGDVHVPLHTTANHNGQLTGQKGLHAHFETAVVDKYVKPEDIHPPQGKQITKSPHTLAFEWVRESFSYVDTILKADADAGGKTGNRDLKKFAKKAAPIAIDRLTNGGSRLASLWYSAWIDGGKPNPANIVI